MDFRAKTALRLKKGRARITDFSFQVVSTSYILLLLKVYLQDKGQELLFSNKTLGARGFEFAMCMQTICTSYTLHKGFMSNLLLEGFLPPLTLKINSYPHTGCPVKAI